MCKFRQIFVAVLLISSAIFVAACGRERGESDYNAAEDEVPIAGIVGTASLPDEEEASNERVLTILAPRIYERMLREAERAMQRSWMNSDEAFRMELTTYEPYEVDNVILRMQTMLMAGQGYDIFFLEPEHSLFHQFRSGLVADIWPLIDNCELTSREDFFTGALEAVSFDGGLYAFPFSFGFQYVGINANLPQEFINRFAALDTIITGQMMEIYLDLLDAHWDEFWHLNFGTCIRVLDREVMIWNKMHEFVDFDARRANLTDDRFVTFIENLMRVYETPPDLMQGAFTGWYPRMMPESYHGIADYFVFSVHNMYMPTMYALLPMYNPPFLHYIPLVDGYNRVRTNIGLDFGWFQQLPDYSSSRWNLLSITAAADGDLAWEFISQHLILASLSPASASGQTGWGITPLPMGFYSVNLPIRRDLVRSGPDIALRAALRDIPPYTFINIDPDNIPRASPELLAVTNTLLTKAEMELAPLPLIPYSIVESNFDYMLRGILPVREALQRVHNTVSLWLIE